MVKVRSMGMDYSDEFCSRYIGMRVGEALQMYAKGLKEAYNQSNQTHPPKPDVYLLKNTLFRG